MSRWVSPDRGAIETQVDSTTYRGRIFDAHPGHEAALRDAGYFPASVGGVSRAKGHTCPACGFNSFFRDCSRCRDRYEDADLALTHEDLTEMAARGVPVEVVGPNGER